MNGLPKDFEDQLIPMVNQLARQFAPSLGMDVEDAMQEARIALYTAFQSYDQERSHGGCRAYARTVLKNMFCGLAYSATTQARCPHTVYTDENGKTRVFKHRRLASLDDLMDENKIRSRCSVGCDLTAPQSATCQPVSEQDLDNMRIADRLRVLRIRLFRVLGRQERMVLKIKMHPPEAFLLFLRNIGVVAAESNNQHIARYLGVTKNSVDYSLLKIRGEFRRLAENDFSDLVTELIRSGDWPMIHVSLKPDDSEFVMETIQSRRLDPRPLPERREVRVGESAGRIIEHYHWGVVLHLRLHSSRATVVVEGRFNKNTGDVFGQHGMWRPITEFIPWYKQLVQEIKTT